MLLPSSDHDDEDQKSTIYIKNSEENEGEILSKRLPLSLLKKSVLKLTLATDPSNKASAPEIISQIYLPYLKFFTHQENLITTEIKNGR